MAIRAYDEIYVGSAQNVLGHAVDFAVMTLGLEPNVFGDAFAVSDASKQFAAGNPAYVAGMNGGGLLDGVGIGSTISLCLRRSVIQSAQWSMILLEELKEGACS